MYLHVVRLQRHEESADDQTWTTTLYNASVRSRMNPSITPLCKIVGCASQECTSSVVHIVLRDHSGPPHNSYALSELDYLTDTLLLLVG